MRWFFVAVAATVLVTTAGCGRPHSKVHGVITYQGKPLKGGTIILVGPDNRTYPARIGSDGSYHIASVPRGEIHVSIQTEPPSPPPRPQPGAKDSDAFAKTASNLDDQAKGGGGQPAAPAAYIMVPARYNDPSQSGLSFELTEADQDYSVDLK
jgi:hypothetical protein